MAPRRRARLTLSRGGRRRRLAVSEGGASQGAPSRGQEASSLSSRGRKGAPPREGKGLACPQRRQLQRQRQLARLPRAGGRGLWRRHAAVLAVALAPATPRQAGRGRGGWGWGGGRGGGGGGAAGGSGAVSPPQAIAARLSHAPAAPSTAAGRAAARTTPRSGPSGKRAAALCCPQRCCRVAWGWS